MLGEFGFGSDDQGEEGGINLGESHGDGHQLSPSGPAVKFLNSQAGTGCIIDLDASVGDDSFGAVLPMPGFGVAAPDLFFFPSGYGEKTSNSPVCLEHATPYELQMSQVQSLPCLPWRISVRNVWSFRAAF